ncbi:hypothetical protein [Pelagovum pacificum]|uniref:Uncharacterized protein n=1 Tax=Pelagovum pacificum TaxID=2588711 RepID=A0A5C5GCX7_9RHOB|nr:hypothetical protein [Pelagovum pacificum]QQA41188.1 hypothetical protein I8N54_10115 [Pelagovum pacificum]TNY32004.1 hypothetical protein FHY64_01485 [Pelagovum pacificum]
MSIATISAVLTGDLVASRTAGNDRVDAAIDALSAAAIAFGDDHHTALRFTRHRGDGWQVHLSDPSLILIAGLWFLARLRAADLGVDTRISIGTGPVDSTGTLDLSDANGPAFHRSGDGLDQMPRRRRLVMAGDGIGPWQDAVADLADGLSVGWTAAQAEAVSHALSPRGTTHEAIAARLGITRQAVQSRLAAAGMAHLQGALDAFRAHHYGEPT